VFKFSVTKIIRIMKYLKSHLTILQIDLFRTNILNIQFSYRMFPISLPTRQTFLRISAQVILVKCFNICKRYIQKDQFKTGLLLSRQVILEGID
jgi:hypothetical protein